MTRSPIEREARAENIAAATMGLIMLVVLAAMCAGCGGLYMWTVDRVLAAQECAP